MYVSHLSLTNFRNYARLDLHLPTGGVLLCGENAQGKTNLLESMRYLSTLRSPFATADRQMVNRLAVEGEPLPFARMEAHVNRGGRDFTLGITIMLAENGNFRKEIRLNGVKKRAMDVVGQLSTVLFLPEDIWLITGPPQERRRYLDTLLCQVDGAYCRSLARYNGVVEQRNALLKALRDRCAGNGAEDELRFWDDTLAQEGALLTVRRCDTIAELDAISHGLHRTLSADKESLRLRYRMGAPPNSGGDALHGLLATVDSSQGPAACEVPPPIELAEMFKAALLELRGEEIARGVSIVGPHRDDVEFLVDAADVSLYGSRGQQRTAALSVKLAEVEFIREAVGEPPVLLLDDVMSEFDALRRAQVLKMLDSVRQVLITTTDREDFSPSFLSNASVFRVEAGCLFGV